MLFQGKWTFLHAFLGKMDFFACFRGESGPLCFNFWKKVDFFQLLLGESGLFWTKLWTILDTFGQWRGGVCFCIPLAMGLAVSLGCSRSKEASALYING